MTDRNAAIHLVAGGTGGTVGAVVTCPLEVIKVRLQSSAGLSCNGNGENHGASTSKFAEEIRSNSTGMRRIIPSWTLQSPFTKTAAYLHGEAKRKGKNELMGRGRFGNYHKSHVLTRKPSVYREFMNLHPRTVASSAEARTADRLGLQVFKHLRHIVKKEGIFALWKGCTPNIVGVAPSKAVYFYSYSTSKRVLNEFMVPNTAWVHMWSAAGAGFIAASVVNPIWLIKTRLQLDRTPETKAMSIPQIIKKVYNEDGFKGFYRGVTASYAGISETIIQFVIYEWLKARFVAQPMAGEKRQKVDFLSFMACGSTGKLVATCLCYPHEVARTRLREEGTKYRKFWRTLYLVATEERRAGLYRGLSVHLLRTIPNTAITMTTYEFVVYLLMRL